MSDYSLAFDDIDTVDVEEIKQEFTGAADQIAPAGEKKNLDLLHVFLLDIGKFPLLNHQQEIDFAKRILKGDQEAHDLLVLHNMRMAVKVASNYYRGKKVQGVSYLDLIQEANIGLIRAATKYDHTKGFRFSTYAMWWVRQAVSRAVQDKSRTIRVPGHIIQELTRITAAKDHLHAELNRAPTHEEIGEYLEIPEQKVSEVLQLTKVPTSLDKPLISVGDDFVDFASALPDNDSLSPHEAVEETVTAELLNQALKELSFRELKIIQMIYGIDCARVENKTDIARIFNITYQRVRQIEMEVLAKLRQNSDIQILRED